MGNRNRSWITVWLLAAPQRNTKTRGEEKERLRRRVRDCSDGGLPVFDLKSFQLYFCSFSGSLLMEIENLAEGKKFFKTFYYVWFYCRVMGYFELIRNPIYMGAYRHPEIWRLYLPILNINIPQICQITMTSFDSCSSPLFFCHILIVTPHCFSKTLFFPTLSYVFVDLGVYLDPT